MTDDEFVGAMSFVADVAPELSTDPRFVAMARRFVETLGFDVSPDGLRRAEEMVRRALPEVVFGRVVRDVARHEAGHITCALAFGTWVPSAYAGPEIGVTHVGLMAIEARAVVLAAGDAALDDVAPGEHTPWDTSGIVGIAECLGVSAAEMVAGARDAARKILAARADLHDAFTKALRRDAALREPKIRAIACAHGVAMPKATPLEASLFRPKADADLENMISLYGTGHKPPKAQHQGAA